jgi:uncharacterized protein YuzE
MTAESGGGPGSRRRARSEKTMKIRYFADTDTLYIELRDLEIAETRDLDQDTIIDVDANGSLLALTFEHASTRTDLSELIVEGIAA